MGKNRAWAIALWLGLFCLSAFFVHWRLKSAYSATYSYFRWAEFGPVPGWVPLVLALRWPMRGVAVAGGLLLAAAEWRAGLVTAGLRRALDGPWQLLLLGMVALASGSYYLLPGDPAFSADAELYTGYAALARQALRAGQFPFWTYSAGLGMPLLQFYGQYQTLVALVGLVVPDLWQATKVAQLALHVLSVFGMYAFVARLAGSRPAGLAAAWAYGFTFYRYHAILFNGVVHMGVHFAVMPWAFYGLERLVDGAGRWRVRGLALAALFGGAALLGHANYGIFVFGFMLLYGLVRVWLAPRAWPLGGKVRATLWLAGALAGALLVGAYPVLGSIVEGDLVSLDRYQGATSFLLGPLAFSQVFSFKGSYWTSEWFGGYVGVSIAGIAALTCLWAAWKRRWRAAALCLCFGLSAYLALGPGRLPFDEIFQRVPLGWIVYTFSTPGRYLLYVTFFGAALVGLGAAYLALAANSGRSSRLPELAALALILAVSADVLPVSMQANSLRPPQYAADAKRVYVWLRDNAPDPAARVLDPVADRTATDIQHYTGLAGFGANVHEVPRLTFDVITVLLRQVREDYEAGRVRPATRDWLYLTNTGAIFSTLPVPPGDRGQTLFASGEAAAVLVPSHSPLVASRSLRPDAQDSAAGLLAEMQLDYKTNSAVFLPLEDDWPGFASLGPEPVALRVLAHAPGPQRVRLTYELSAPAFVQLAYADYRYQEVRLDGQRIATAPSRFGFVVFQSEAGQHTVELIPYLSPLRVGILIADVVFVLATLALSRPGRSSRPVRS